MLFENSKNVRGLYSTESLSYPQQRIGNGQLLEEYNKELVGQWIWKVVGSQREELRPWQGVIKLQETPCSGASTPKTRVLYGELSRITISLREGVNLQLQLIKVPGRDKSVSTYEL